MYFLEAEEVKKIPQESLPLLVLSDNLRSFISWGIKAHQHGDYNHLMWMHRPGFVVTQGWTLREDPIEKYLPTHRLKFWTGQYWSPQNRRQVCRALYRAARQPWYKRVYDPLQILGKFLNIPWIQLPGLNICSDHADILSMLQVWERGRHLSPPEVNRRMIEIPTNVVYGRYVPD